MFDKLRNFKSTKLKMRIDDFNARSFIGANNRMQMNGHSRGYPPPLAHRALHASPRKLVNWPAGMRICRDCSGHLPAQLLHFALLKNASAHTAEFSKQTERHDRSYRVYSSSVSSNFVVFLIHSADTHSSEKKKKKKTVVSITNQR